MVDMFKYKAGDLVIVTGGKDKGKKAKIIKVLAQMNQVVVEGVNLYTRHIKKTGERAGQKVRKERPLPVAKVAILNDQGKPDRVGFLVDKKGQKLRVFRKTGKLVKEPKKEKQS